MPIETPDLTASPLAHGRPSRGLQSPTRSRLHVGMFGRMFRHLDPCLVRDEWLVALATTMVDHETNQQIENARPLKLLAGYTYFGQFIDHDLTFDPSSLVQRTVDPDGLVDFRTPRFDLDSFYGRGPDDQPYLYEEDAAQFVLRRDFPSQGEYDLPRNEAGRAIMADPRNDANAIVSQLHLAFIRFHNKIVRQLSNGRPEKQFFEPARRLVTWHYQWLVINEFLPLIVGKQTAGAVLQPAPQPVAPQPASANPGRGVWRSDLRFFDWANDPFMPVEFSAAAFRFGHSMVRDHYSMNRAREVPGVPIFDVTRPNDDLAEDLRGFRRRLPGMRIEWDRFLTQPGANTEKLQRARPIDALLVPPLSQLPFKVAGATEQASRSLPLRNLFRGKSLELPSGQSVAKAMGVPDAEILGIGQRFTLDSRGATGDLTNVGGQGISLTRLQEELAASTPLWYYILREASVLRGGEELGPVGGRIVAEVIVGLMIADHYSYLNVEPNWKPKANEFGCAGDGSFSLAGLIAWAEV